jgi:hypothetical protein
MVPEIHKYIQQHIDNWQLDGNKRSPLWPLLRANKECDYIVAGYPIGSIIFWFNTQDRFPILVTKIMSTSVKLPHIMNCKRTQEYINDRVGQQVFPRIFDAAQIAGRPVIFQEAVNHQTYEKDLIDAINGPERSLAQLRRVTHQQLGEMGWLFNKLRQIRITEVQERWDDWAYELAGELKTRYNFDTSSLDPYLEDIKRDLKGTSVYHHPILVEHGVGNIFPRPKIIDQIHPIVYASPTYPADLDVFRFLIAYFRASPLVSVFNNWPYPICGAIMDKEDQTILGGPVRGILEQSGFDLDRPGVVLSHLVTALLARIKVELGFHSRNSLLIERLIKGLERDLRRLMQTYDLVKQGKGIQLAPLINAQEVAFGKSKDKPQITTRCKKVAIFGSGSGGQKALQYLKGKGIKVSFFVDNNPQTWGSRGLGALVCPPTELVHRRKDYDICVIASVWADTIAEQLQAMRLVDGKDFVTDVTLL